MPVKWNGHRKLRLEGWVLGKMILECGAEFLSQTSPDSAYVHPSGKFCKQWRLPYLSTSGIHCTGSCRTAS